MSRTVIKVENLGKEYVIGGCQGRHETFREMLMSSAAAPIRRLRRLRGKVAPQERIWALRNVNFDLEEGEVLGIIGRNGAGKSTLLKILSRITDPTEGCVEIRGRVASLLEVGTGFHPELTGRENIYLNGALLGMTWAEISRRFDAIVDFSGVEHFLDTPVKRYSSGMHLRLAFSVAAHLEPEILIVDEVLAVGDADFQKRCLGKMEDVASRGRTVVFVSHNMWAIAKLCRTVLTLANGRAFPLCGDVQMEIRRYLGIDSLSNHSATFERDPSKPSIIGIDVDANSLPAGDLIVEIAFASPHPLQRAIGGILLSATTGEPVWESNARLHPPIEECPLLASGLIRCEARRLPVAPGQYVLSAYLGDPLQDYDSKLDALSVFLGSESSDPLLGHVNWPAAWRYPRQNAAE